MVIYGMAYCDFDMLLSYLFPPHFLCNPVHDDNRHLRWRHDLETLFTLLALVRWIDLITGRFMMSSSNRNIFRVIHRSPVNSPHKGQWRGALMFSLICAWINGWVNNGEAGDLRRHRVHYDVTIMLNIDPFHFPRNRCLLKGIHCHLWGIFSYLGISWNVLQGWYILTYSLECLTTFYICRE